MHRPGLGTSSRRLACGWPCLPSSYAAPAAHGRCYGCACATGAGVSAVLSPAEAGKLAASVRGLSALGEASRVRVLAGGRHLHLALRRLDGVNAVCCRAGWDLYALLHVEAEARP